MRTRRQEPNKNRVLSEFKFLDHRSLWQCNGRCYTRTIGNRGVSYGIMRGNTVEFGSTLYDKSQNCVSFSRKIEIEITFFSVSATFLLTIISPFPSSKRGPILSAAATLTTLLF